MDEVMQGIGLGLGRHQAVKCFPRPSLVACTHFHSPVLPHFLLFSQGWCKALMRTIKCFHFSPLPSLFLTPCINLHCQPPLDLATGHVQSAGDRFGPAQLL